MSWNEWTDSEFRGLNLEALRVNEAYFTYSNAMNKSFNLYSLSDFCNKCPFRKLRSISPLSENSFRLNVARGYEMRLFDTDFGDFVFPNQTATGVRWSAKPNMGQFGVYDLNISNSDVISFEVAKEPVNIYFCEIIATVFKCKF